MDNGLIDRVLRKAGFTRTDDGQPTDWQAALPASEWLHGGAWDESISFDVLAGLCAEVARECAALVVSHETGSSFLVRERLAAAIREKFGVK